MRPITETRMPSQVYLYHSTTLKIKSFHQIGKYFTFVTWAYLRLSSGLLVPLHNLKNGIFLPSDKFLESSTNKFLTIENQNKN